MSHVVIVRQPDYQLAPLYNNAALLAPLEGRLVPGETIPFQTFKGWGPYDPGDIFIDGLGLEAYDGFPTTAWITAFVTPLQDAWLSDTYCNGGRAGLVTQRTKTDRYNTFSNFNAVLRLPKLSESDFVRNGKNIRAYKLTFTRLVAI